MGVAGAMRAVRTLQLAIVVLPVNDVERAKAFYRSAGFCEDMDYSCGAAFRIVQFTPPGSTASIVFGEGITSARPGSVQGLVLGVPDLQAAREDLLADGVAVSEVFHDSGGVFYHLAPAHLEVGPDPDRRDRASFARFSDPDGNSWVIREEGPGESGGPTGCCRGRELAQERQGWVQTDHRRNRRR